MRLKLAILFDNWGPYHLARLGALSELCRLLAIQVHQRSSDYSWHPPLTPPPFPAVTLDDVPTNHGRGCHRRLCQILADFAPDCVFVPGWGRRYCLAALAWSRAHGVRVALMSESTQHDLRRCAWKEWLKRRFLALCSAALVGGSRHREYLTTLGMAPGRTCLGYDVVDNDYFRANAKLARNRAAELRNQSRLPERYFLVSARFVPKKNLLRLLDAFALYRSEFESLSRGCRPRSNTKPWALVMLGDGPQESDIRRIITEQGLEDLVFLEGFRQYPDLPQYYGLASALVLPSTSEPWGLVVNEAMACGLPVLVSQRCGCVPELVREGYNGFTFDPTDVGQLASLMVQVSTAGSALVRMSEASWELISGWGPERFAQGALQAASIALNRAGKAPSPQAFLP